MSAYSDKVRRPRQLKVALSDEERAEIKTRADALGVSMAELMRRRALGQNLPAPATEEGEKMWREIGFFFRDISLASRDVREHLEQREGDADVPEDVAALHALLTRIRTRMEDFEPTLLLLREALER